MSRNDYEKFIQRQDIGKGMGGKSDYEKMVMAAVVHDIGKFWQGTGEGGKHLSMNMSVVDGLLKILVCSNNFQEQNKNDP